jgi:DNA-directed RNA polymerase specialized sigma24 family protein
MVHLTDNEQAAVRLIICRGLSYEQAARSLGVNVSTINNWKHRGVNKLRRIIDEKRSESHREDPGGGRDPA